jgi:hypothetical protein
MHLVFAHLAHYVDAGDTAPLADLFVAWLGGALIISNFHRAVDCHNSNDGGQNPLCQSIYHDLLIQHDRRSVASFGASAICFGVRCRGDQLA